MYTLYNHATALYIHYKVFWESNQLLIGKEFLLKVKGRIHVIFYIVNLSIPV